ncbi:hypothetical protein BCR43DRAFT_423499, partial [Syncephalastrum racemosum]
IRLLYHVAHEQLAISEGQGKETQNGITHICTAMTSQARKIQVCVNNGDAASINKAKSYIQDTIEYLGHQERKYGRARDTTPLPVTPAIQYLSKKRPDDTQDPPEDMDMDNLTRYAEKFRHPRNKKISWVACFKQGVEDDNELIKVFANSESLRPRINKYMKRTKR